MIAHPDTATKAALCAYHERIEQARRSHIINLGARARTGAPVDATGNDTQTRRSTRVARSIKRLLGSERRPDVVGGSRPGTLNPPPMTANPT